MKRSLVCALALLLISSSAWADQESWNWLELRLPVPGGGDLAPTSVRFVTNARFGGRYPGLGFLAFRVGPIWDVNQHLFIAAHATAIALQTEPKVFTQEYRLELEPNLRGRVGEFTFNDRNRVELRWVGGDVNWRYRNQLRVNYQPEGARWIPYVADELIFNLSAAELSQNRAEVGIGWAFMPSARIDLGYMLRTRRVGASGWANDNVLNLQLYFAPPPPSK